MHINHRFIPDLAGWMDGSLRVDERRPCFQQQGGCQSRGALLGLGCSLPGPVTGFTRDKYLHQNGNPGVQCPNRGMGVLLQDFGCVCSRRGEDRTTHLLRAGARPLVRRHHLLPAGARLA